jgi:tellurite resistance protein
MQDYQQAMLKSLVAVAWADGRVDAEEHEVIEALISAFEVGSEDAEHIRDYAKAPKSIDDVPLSDLSASDRRVLLQHAVILTYIDGNQSAKEKEVLSCLVTKLRVPAEEATQILADAETRAKRLLSLL